MPIDQAAGLRRRNAGRAPFCIHCVSDSAATALRLAQALQGRGHRPLLVDARDRLFAGTATQALFDWTQQLARGRLFVLPLDEIAAWHAPGVAPDAPGLLQAAREHDVLVFDSSPAQAATVPPGVPGFGLLAVRQDSLDIVYAVLKTRAQSGAAAAILFGDAQACERVRTACARFLDATVAAAVTSIPDEDDAIAALAVRMAGEEQGCHPQYKTGNP